MDKIIGSDGAKITHFINLDEGEVMEVENKETAEKDEVAENTSGQFQQADAGDTKKEDGNKKETQQKQPTKPMLEDKDEL